MSGTPPQADQPIAAIVRRTEDRITTAKHLESSSNVVRQNIRDV
jgi:hypothetical protein